MDLLDRVYPVARDVLTRVDDVLCAGGAPSDHAVWPLLRRVGGLPGEVTAEFTAVPVAPLAGVGDPLRVLADRYDSGHASVPMPASWRGPAAESYASQWAALAGHLCDDRDSMAGRLTDSAGFLDDVAAWLARGRRALAGVLAECLGCAEAVAVHSAPAGPPTPGVVTPAATIATEVLGVLGEILDDGDQLAARWTGRLGELPYRPPSPAGTSAAVPIGLG